MQGGQNKETEALEGSKQELNEFSFSLEQLLSQMLYNTIGMSPFTCP